MEGFSPCFHLAGLRFGYTFLTHTHLVSGFCRLSGKSWNARGRGHRCLSFRRQGVECHLGPPVAPFFSFFSGGGFP